MKTKDDRRERIRLRQRKRISGTAERPRLAVFRSEAHLYAQVIDDLGGRTLVAASTVEPTVRAQLGEGARGSNVAGASVVGRVVAERLREQGITRVVFDRGGFLYHGRVKALAEAAREAGLEF
ncbi:MAG: 50S ribosomal protein L18 [Acidobacteria bacterium]|nr:50S ribosomal protein L18 [Acidobacteriota bacterium]